MIEGVGPLQTLAGERVTPNSGRQWAKLSRVVKAGMSNWGCSVVLRPRRSLVPMLAWQKKTKNDIATCSRSLPRGIAPPAEDDLYRSHPSQSALAY